MKKITYTIWALLLSLHSQLYATDAGVLGWVTKEKLRNGDIHTDDIPKIISYAIDYLMGIAGTIAIIYIILWAYRIALGTIEWDKSKGKETIIYALAWFILASLSWIIMKFVIDNFA